MTTRTKIALAVALLAGLASAAGVYFLEPSEAPPQQKPLATLSQETFAEFEAEFDSAADSPRLLLLLSPT